MKIRILVLILILAVFGGGMIALRSFGSKRKFIGGGIDYTRWSNDGNILFYSQDNDKVIRYDLGTGNRQIYNTPERLDVFEVSPDNKSIAFIGRRWFGLCTQHLGSSRVDKIHQLDDTREVFAIWWLPQNRILFEQDNKMFMRVAYLVDLNSKKLKVFRREIARSIGVSADGAVYAYYDDNYRAHLCDLNTGKDRLIGIRSPVVDRNMGTALFLSKHQFIYIYKDVATQLDFVSMKSRKISVPDLEDLEYLSPDLTKSLYGSSSHPDILRGWVSNKVYVQWFPEQTVRDLRCPEVSSDSKNRDGY